MMQDLQISAHELTMRPYDGTQGQYRLRISDSVVNLSPILSMDIEQDFILHIAVPAVLT